MKRFFKKIFYTILIITIMIVTINKIYMRATYGKNYSGDYTEKFMTIENGIQISNTGSSHGLRAFNYDNLNEYKCFNFALVSQSLSYDYRLVLNYSDKLADNGVMFIPISYFSFFGEDESLEENFKLKNRRYYRILPSDMIKGYDLKTDFFTNYFPALDSYEKFIMPFVGYEPAYREVTTKVSDLGMDENSLAAAGYGRAESHIAGEGTIDENGKRIINYDEIEACYNIIELCKSKGIRPILITTPYLQEYTDGVKMIAPCFENDFTSIISEIQTKTGAEYYDYSDDIRFRKRYDLFYDMDHLNADGAQKFTAAIMKELVAESEK